MGFARKGRRKEPRPRKLGSVLDGLFEVQVLDSFENPTYVDGQAASLYGQYPPLVNASRKPGEWQSYDIIFRRQRFGTDGQLTSPAFLTVLHNGVLVQDHVAAYGPTSWLQFQDPKPHANKLPLSLQDHGNPVRYRNIWIRELPEMNHLPPAEAYDPTVIQLNKEQVSRLVGKYDRYEIVRVDRQLQMKFVGRTFDLIPHSPTEFGLKYTAAK